MVDMRIDTRRNNNLDNILFWLFTIDLLFLPYYSFMSVTISAPIMVIWLFFHFKELLRGRECYAMLIIIVWMMISTIIGMLYDDSYLRFETSARTTLLRFLQYIICFGYYFFYRKYFSENEKNISKVFLIFSIYVCIFAVAFMLFPREYAEIKILINPADNHTRRYLAGTIFYRFNYLWTDPNNIAYLLDGVAFWYILDDYQSMRNKILMLVTCLVSVLATASNGGLIIFSFVAIYVILTWAVSNRRISVRSITTIIASVLLLIVVIRYTQIGDFIRDELITKVSNRFLIYRTGSNLSGGRGNDIITSLKLLNPMFLIIGSGKEGFTNEIGHLYWICFYGFPSYIAFMYVTFAKFKYVPWKKYVWIFPFFVAFTINIAIGEFKWMGILFLLLSFSRYSTIQHNNIPYTDIEQHYTYSQERKV